MAATAPIVLAEEDAESLWPKHEDIPRNKGGNFETDLNGVDNDGADLTDAAGVFAPNIRAQTEFDRQLFVFTADPSKVTPLVGGRGALAPLSPRIFGDGAT